MISPNVINLFLSVALQLQAINLVVKPMDESILRNNGTVC